VAINAAVRLWKLKSVRVQRGDIRLRCGLFWN